MPITNRLIAATLVACTCIFASCTSNNTPLGSPPPAKVGTIGINQEMVGTWRGKMTVPPFLGRFSPSRDSSCYMTLSLYADGRFERDSPCGLPSSYGWGYWGADKVTFYLQPVYIIQAIWSGDALVDWKYDIVGHNSRRLLLRRVTGLGTFEIQLEHVSRFTQVIWPGAEWPSEWFVEIGYGSGN